MPFFDHFRKKQVAAAAAKAGHATRHCFVLCKTALPDDLSIASRVVSEVFGAGCSAECDDNNVTVTQGNKTIGLLVHTPSAIPNGEAEQHAAGNFLWPNGREEAASHRSHVIVSKVGGGDQSPIQSAIAVSQLALVALKLFDGIGVYWGNACVCNSRTVFEDFCQDMCEEHVPVPVWLRFQLFRASDDGIGLYTLGMRQFDLMDIEVDRCTMHVGDLFDCVSNVAHYLIQRGPVILDGNTVGGRDGERILVRHRPSMIEKTKTVYKIIFES